MSDPIYGIEVTYQSGKVSVKSVYLEKNYADIFFNMASTLVGRVDPVDGVASVRLVKCKPVWEECDSETGDLGPNYLTELDETASWRNDSGDTKTSEDETCPRCDGSGCEPSPTDVPMIGAPTCMSCYGTGKRPKFSNLAATVRNHPANVKETPCNNEFHTFGKCPCYKVDL